jgi:hypothetical protein
MLNGLENMVADCSKCHDEIHGNTEIILPDENEIEENE